MSLPTVMKPLYRDRNMTNTMFPYHFLPLIVEKRIAHPEGFSNILNELGYVVGIINKTIPYESCMEVGIAIIPCELESQPW